MGGKYQALDNNAWKYQVTENFAYSSTYQTIYDAMTTKPTPSIADAQDKLVRTLISDEVWDKLDVFYVFAQYVNSDLEALINWIDPGTYDASLVNTPAFVSLEGFTSDGSTSYIRTNYNPSTNGTNYLKDDASLGLYIRDNIFETKFDIGYNNGAAYTQMGVRSAGNVYLSRINSASTDLSIPTTDSRGMHILTRADGTTISMYKNKRSVGSGNIFSTSIPSGEIYILTLNNNGTPQFHSTRQASVGFLGGSLTQTDVDNMTDAVEVYMTSNNKNVIPTIEMLILGDSISDNYTDVMWVDYITAEYGINNFADREDSIIADMANQVAASSETYSDVIICFLGTNDDNAGDMTALQAEVETNLIQLASDHTAATIYYVNVLPRWTNVGGGTEVDKSNIRTAIAAACAAQGITVWDTYTDPWIIVSDTSDGVHPNASGSEKIWDEIELRI